jgi:GNAT superfamily N-acetyltransferase
LWQRSLSVASGFARLRERVNSNVRPDNLLQFRSLSITDQDKLWHWLHVALWDAPPAGLRPLEVLQVPGVRIYAENWGQPTDVGVVAQVDGTDAGACWVRLLPAGIGLASVDAETPQLGIALEPALQHMGYGRPLMLETLKAAARAGYRQLSLTVHPENPAQYMYESCGFRKVERRNNYHLMVTNVA